jgi:hypothetical protein
MKKIIVVSMGVALFGCASHSGVVPIGQDTYMMSKQAATGFGGLGSLKAELFAEANQHCGSEGKRLQVVNTHENAGPYILGNYPRAEIQYMCLRDGDHELARPKLTKSPDTVMEIRNMGANK